MRTVSFLTRLRPTGARSRAGPPMTRLDSLDRALHDVIRRLEDRLADALDRAARSWVNLQIRVGRSLEQDRVRHRFVESDAQGVYAILRNGLADDQRPANSGAGAPELDHLFADRI